MSTQGPTIEAVLAQLRRLQGTTAWPIACRALDRALCQRQNGMRKRQKASPQRGLRRLAVWACAAAMAISVLQSSADTIDTIEELIAPELQDTFSSA